MIPITESLSLDESTLHEEFIRSAGPGGQNVNKVETAVQLRFDAAAADLPEAVRARLLALAGTRATAAGVVVVTARAGRTQVENRAAALEQLVSLLRRAAIAPTPRRATRPSAAARAQRMEAKRRRSATKQARRIDGDA